jgi:O-antigen ligase
MIDAIPMSIFAVTAISATFASQWALPKLVLWFAAALGIYFNLVVATRTMILAAFATLAILVPVQLFTSQRRNRLVAAVFIVGALAGISALISLAATAGGGASPLLQRISNVGDDGRLAVWQEAIPLVFDYPAGGGIVHLSAESWGHNLFLDAALINGWLGTLVMFTLYGFIFFVVVRSIRRAGMLTQPVGIALTGGLIGSFMASMVHPPQPAFITFALLAGSFSVALLLESNVRSTQEPQPASPGRRLPKPGLVWASPA